MDVLERSEFEVKTFGHPSKESGLNMMLEITRLRQLLSEAETREREARAKVLGDAAEAIFVMGAWSPKYEKLTRNTFDEGTSAAYEVVRELQGNAESALQSEGR
ncbi:hypothetical protein O9X81_05445 [Agrobacterium salinitolerans]|uniref:hypothetical protein n=1 Tax=Agrobacterium salinitolerans TaxID=1183413 RepID=UPI0022B84DD4|nr:hypothetical protein [Agrobacterium salinitolerans]MCZ7856051.1 hypothetical protein [Agrobacterium salinitolerans]